MHANSLAAYHEARDALTGRRAAVYEWIKEHGKATDRQVMKGLGFKDMNAVRPRITELVNAGLLEEVGNTRDKATGKTVRVVQVKEGNADLFSEDTKQ